MSYINHKGYVNHINYKSYISHMSYINHISYTIYISYVLHKSVNIACQYLVHIIKYRKNILKKRFDQFFICFI